MEQLKNKHRIENGEISVKPKGIKREKSEQESQNEVGIIPTPSNKISRIMSIPLV